MLPFIQRKFGARTDATVATNMSALMSAVTSPIETIEPTNQLDDSLPAASPTAARVRHALPEAALPVTIHWSYAISIVAIHLFALLAFLPYYFSWTGVVLALVGL